MSGLVGSGFEPRHVSPGRFGRVGSGPINGRGIDQHDRDVVLDGVNAPAFAAFQALSVRVQDHRLLANRANQHGEQILRNHSGSIVARR